MSGAAALSTCVCVGAPAAIPVAPLIQRPPISLRTPVCSTSNEDGVGIAWAVCERLAVATTAYTLCVTHFHELAELATLYPNVRNRCMAVSMRGGAGTDYDGDDGSGGSAGATAARAAVSDVSGEGAALGSLAYRFTVSDGSSPHTCV